MENPGSGCGHSGLTHSQGGGRSGEGQGLRITLGQFSPLLREEFCTVEALCLNVNKC